MPRFVLLYHKCPPKYERASHWDLMLELGDTLRTWALDHLPHDWKAVHSRTVSVDANCPALSEENKVVGEQLGDHRKDYLHLEGELSGDHGTVTRVAEGTYCKEDERTADWRITLVGDELSGCVTLARLDSAGSRWSLECVPTG